MRTKVISILFRIFVVCLHVPLLGAILEEATPAQKEVAPAPDKITAPKESTAAEAPGRATIEEVKPSAQTGRELKSAEEFTQPAIRPETAVDDQKNKVEVNFEDTDLSNITSWISKLFNVSFITNDAIIPSPKGVGLVASNKLTFKSHIALTKRQVWDLFVIFLDLSGLSVRSSSIRPNFYQVVSVSNQAPDAITNQPLPSYVNVDWRALPENDMYVRYVYFLQNMRLNSIYDVIDNLRSKNAKIAQLPYLEAFMITDKAYNIRTLMQVVEQLDGIALPEAMSVLTLKNADAEEVGQLYKTLTSGDQQERRIASFLGQRNVPTKKYFPENVKIIVEKRTNSLIILGDRKSIRKIEDFITNYVDTELKQPYSPLYVYDLQYTNAKDIATILDEVVNNYAKESVAREYGSVRRGEKYLQRMQFEPEQDGNRLIVKGEKEDWLMVRRIIEQLDVPQPQVAIEVLVVNVIGTDNKELGVQIRNKTPEQINPNINWQESGLPDGGGNFSPPVVRPRGSVNPGSIAADLITLAQAQTIGSTLISVGTAATGGVWALFKMLQSHTRTEILSNPYLVTTNNYEALISLGETRRVTSSTVVSGSTSETSQVDKTAALTVRVKPQINREGIINLEIFFELSTFNSAATSSTSANTNEHKSRTTANIADGEVLAFGGFMQTEMDETIAKTPLLGDVPVLGWFFKNETKSKIVNNIIVFISPHIVEPRLQGGLSGYSAHKVKTAEDTLCWGDEPIQKRDPIHRWFFKDHVQMEQDTINGFITEKKISGEISAETLQVGDEGAEGSEIAPTQEPPIAAEEASNKEQPVPPTQSTKKPVEPVLPPPANKSMAQAEKVLTKRESNDIVIAQNTPTAPRARRQKKGNILSSIDAEKNNKSKGIMT